MANVCYSATDRKRIYGEIQKLIQAGKHPSDAATALGVKKETYYRWNKMLGLGVRGRGRPTGSINGSGATQAGEAYVSPQKPPKQVKIDLPGGIAVTITT